jgi:hypothetical protein
MVVETIRQYWLLGYRPICNNELVLLPGEPFEPTGMSEVMWVFYASKVRGAAALRDRRCWESHCTRSDRASAA